jgi:hypothetical protein
MNATANFARCLAVAAFVGTLTAGPLQAALRPIDLQHSRLTVFVYKSGLLSAFADNHLISAPLSRGTISEAQPLSIEFVVATADLVVLDPDLDPAKRREIHDRMLGADVLDAGRFSTIRFESTSVEPNGQDRWNVSGRLTIRDITRVVTVSAVRLNGRYRGEVRIKQRDFGIEPIRVAGGTIRVKDELKVEFEIAAMETDHH